MINKKFVLQTPRGTYDILPEQQNLWRQIETVMFEYSENFGFKKITTPYFEYDWIFSKSIGEQTDIVKKEMYELSRGGAPLGLSLRPEGTAGVVRAYYSHGLYTEPTPLRLYYYGPMFRHEKPQRGRFRQFYQFGVESIGDIDPSEDSLIITLGNQILSALEIPPNKYNLEINSIGCEICRPKYIDKLRKYLKKISKNLCDECTVRSVENPLRVFDCKVKKCQKNLNAAPLTLDNLCSACKDHFKNVLEYLEETDISFTINYKLVRGLDYYTKTVFEFVSNSGSTAGQALIAGGRYDNLIEKFGRRSAPAIGFGIGIERTISLLDDLGIKHRKENIKKVFIIQLGNSAKKKAISLIRELASAKICADSSFSRDSLKSQLRAASRSGARYAIIIGQREILDNTVIIKDMQSGGQEIVDQGNYLSNILSKLQ